jgi:hypothetical protein
MAVIATGSATRRFPDSLIARINQDASQRSLLRGTTANWPPPCPVENHFPILPVPTGKPPAESRASEDREHSPTAPARANVIGCAFDGRRHKSRTRYEGSLLRRTPRQGYLLRSSGGRHKKDHG